MGLCYSGQEVLSLQGDASGGHAVQDASASTPAGTAGALEVGSRIAMVYPCMPLAQPSLPYMSASGDTAHALGFRFGACL